MRSLVLVGHGSHIDGHSADGVYQVAELIRTRELFTEVVEGFWKEEPSLRQVLRTTYSTDITVVPMFISEGYFTETVIPRELSLGHQGPVPAAGIARVMGGHTVRYTRPYGVHPAMQDVILARAQEALPRQADRQAEQQAARDTALIVVGRGQDSGSGRRVLEQHAEALRQRGIFAEVHALFLEQTTSLADRLQEIGAAQMVVVPFFGTESHQTREVLPRALGLEVKGLEVAGPEVKGLEAGPAQDPARQLYLAAPVGTHPLIADVVLQLVKEADSRPGDVDRSHRESWATLTRLAWNGLRVGEVVIGTWGHLFELRHMLDEHRSSNELVTYVTPAGLRDHIRYDDAGQFRPVRTFRNLPRGWRAVVDEQDLHWALHTIYPAVTEETRAFTCHDLRPTPWPTTARRQTGRYARVQQASLGQVEQVAAQVCAPCLRTRLWAGESLNATFLDGVPGGMPCAEACTYLIAAVRDHLGKSGDSPATRRGNGT